MAKRAAKKKAPKTSDIDELSELLNKPNSKPDRNPFGQQSRQVLSQVLVYLVRKHFYLFCVYYDPEFYTEDKPHLQTIAEALEDVAYGRTKKLAISLPPRAGKSYTVSLWCAWLIGRGVDNPDTSIMRNAYGGSLADKFSYDVREIVQSDKFKAVFDTVSIKSNHSRIDDWAIEGAAQSTYFCAGVGGAITGKGCSTAAIADDLIKNLEDALSETILDKTWGWYMSTHKSRMEAGCPEVQIATRWSNKDPIGRVLDKQPGEWRTIVVPALTEDGTSFCEKVKTTEEYLELKALLDDMIWQAEFMQNPIEAKGLLFPKASLNEFTMAELERYYNPKTPERFDACFGYTDTADEGTDYLASGVVKVVGERLYLVDVIFTQDTIEITEPLVGQQLIDHEVSKHQVESNNGGKGFALNIRKLVRKKGGMTTVKWVPNTTNKQTRILMASGEIKSYVWFRSDYKPGSDYDRFMQNLTSYVKMGKNKHDDAPDMLAGLMGMIRKPGIRFLENNYNKRVA